MPKFKADLYLRKSYTDDRTVESDSITNQRKLIEDFVAKHPDIEIVHERVDDGYSGIVFDRPAFKEMMQAIGNGEINCVIVKDLSRLGREYNETFTYLRRIFPQMGVRFIAITDNIDTLNEAVTGDLAVSFKGVINDEYCRDISIKVRSALNIKRANGEFVGSIPVYGYVKDENNKNHLVPDEYASRVVQDIFKMRIDGYSADRIAGELNRLGIHSPREYKKAKGMPVQNNSFGNKHCGKWSATTIIRILKDEVYTGKLIQGKRGTPNYKIKEIVDRNPDEIYITENAHEAIITDRDFATVQRLMQLDTRIAPKEERVHIFSGMLICGCCGARMTRKILKYKDKQYFYYYCPTGKKKGCNGGNMIKEDDLIECVLNTIKGHIKNIVDMKSLIESISEKRINISLYNKISAQIEETKEQLKKTNAYKSTLYENFISGILNKDDYRELKKRYNADAEKYATALSEFQQQLDDCANNTSKKLQWIEQFQRFENITELDRCTVIHLLSSIHIYDKTNLQITFNFEDEYKSILQELTQIQLKEAM
ncbi:MAG: recombinase family protein [Clostridia bacterium]|nr:recombinase family protein [Clostridia bacterium]